MAPVTAARPGPRASLGAAIVAGAGHVVHNLAEFPPAVLLWPATLVPVGVTALLAWAMVRHPARRVYLVAAVWAALVAAVGGTSVLPLPVWPFDPPQTPGHYLAHVVYVLAQGPLLWVGWRGYLSGR